MSGFVSGILVAGYLTSALFFARFWVQSRDRLFLFFGIAFSLLAVQRALLALLAPIDDATLLYGLRLFAFLVILYAIWEKNRPA